MWQSSQSSRRGWADFTHRSYEWIRAVASPTAHHATAPHHATHQQPANKQGGDDPSSKANGSRRYDFAIHGRTS
jgi:hypothetical protein